MELEDISHKAKRSGEMNMIPKVDFAKIPSEIKNSRIFNMIVKKNGCIRTTKPKIDKNDSDTGKAAYVWRMVVFIVSSNPQHQHMPMTADFYLPAYDKNGKWKTSIAREMAIELKPLEDTIINSVDKNEWNGAKRWLEAFCGY